MQHPRNLLRDPPPPAMVGEVDSWGNLLLSLGRFLIHCCVSSSGPRWIDLGCGSDSKKSSVGSTRAHNAHDTSVASI